MKNMYNNIGEEEKQRILEMHQTRKELINEQNVLSGIKAGVKGFGQRLKTGAQNVKSAFSTTGGNAKQKSAGLEQDLTAFKSRCSDLANSVNSGYKAMYEMSQKLTKPDAYGAGYGEEQTEFQTTINNILKLSNDLKTACDNASAYQVNYGTAKTPEPQQSTTTEKPSGGGETETSQDIEKL
jgi:hypothetical protein